MAVTLTANQETFAQTLAKQTGLNLNVVRAWVLQENGGGSANGANNWLGLGITGSGSYGTSSPVWTNPVSAAIATAQWIKGAAFPGYGVAAPAIQAIAKTAGESPSAQIAAIQVPSSQGGWSGKGEPDLPTLYTQLTGSPITVTASPNAPATPTVSSAPAPAPAPARRATGCQAASTSQPGFWKKAGLTIALVIGAAALIYTAAKPGHLKPPIPA